jgi:hypothetical protein
VHNESFTWLQIGIRKWPQPAPVLGYGLINGPKFGLIWLLLSIHFKEFIHGFMASGPGVMRHKSAAATMDQTDIRGLVTTVHVSVVEAASL